MFLEYTLINNQKKKSVTIELFPLAQELYEELERLNIVHRLQTMPQLGMIRVSKKVRKSRYDYLMLQLYFHQLIRSDDALQTVLPYTYGNAIQQNRFRKDVKYLDRKVKPSLYDLLQILTLCYNIGHFYSTFVGSRAAVEFSKQNSSFKEAVIDSFSDLRFRTIAKNMFDNMNYLRYHLVNTLLVLQRCDQNKFSVQLAREMIYTYMCNDVEKESKLRDVFNIFRTVRNISYIAYDLQMARVPLNIDIFDAKAILLLFKELLSAYNDNGSTKNMIKSMSKLLDDTVYNEESNTICHCMVRDAMIRNLRDVALWDKESYYSLWEDVNSVINCSRSQRRDYGEKGILKLTFERNHRVTAQKLFYHLHRTNGVRVGYYDRQEGEQTIVVSLKSNCKNKMQVAFRVLRIAIRYLREIAGLCNHDPRYLLTVKFFLFYLLGENPIRIKPTIDPDICVLCTKGKKQRKKAVKKLLEKEYGGEDAAHEAEHLCNILDKNEINDVCIALPSSIVVYDHSDIRKSICEFDGMILYPNRKSGQLVFLEAKNRAYKPELGRRELMEKLQLLNISYDSNKIEKSGKDAYFYYDIP
ncbi:MAG: hypothetical protein IKM59_00330 [Oscillospiraceae bacterium]|nr:hypothetical protein [Oscillospiraceae bacterium]